MEQFRSNQPVQDRPATPGVRIARVFDSYHAATGGQFEPDHLVLSEGDEAARVLRYLEAGAVVLDATAAGIDVFDPEAGAVVPMSFRTDGTWVWTDTTTYYLRTYALSPDLDLLTHIRERDYDYAGPDADAVHQALAAVLAPSMPAGLPPV